MTDANGVIHASYDYDSFGRQTKVSGDLDSDFGYTGLYVERAVCLDFSLTRIYDPEKGRWLSRDPQLNSESPNLYDYVMNKTFRYIDLLGLSAGMPHAPLPDPGPITGPNNPSDCYVCDVLNFLVWELISNPLEEISEWMIPPVGGSITETVVYVGFAPTNQPFEQWVNGIPQWNWAYAPSLPQMNPTPCPLSH
jgi:RHS repeat-associated protein